MSYPNIQIPLPWSEAAESITFSPSSSHPPIVFICGPKNSGKSTFSRHLANVLLRRFEFCWVSSVPLFSDFRRKILGTIMWLIWNRTLDNRNSRRPVACRSILLMNTALVSFLVSISVHFCISSCLGFKGYGFEFADLTAVSVKTPHR